MKKLIVVLALMVSFNAQSGLIGGAAIVEYRDVIGHVDRQNVTASRKECESMAADFSYKTAIKIMCHTFTHEDLAAIATNYYSLNCDNVINEKDAEIDDDSIRDPLTIKESRMGNAEFCKLASEANGQKPDNKAIQETQSEQTKSEDLDKMWQADWGNGIIATVLNDKCGNIELINQDYDYRMIVSIPVARLKQPDDAWETIGDRAITMTGCWSKKEGSIIHAKLIRKKGNKITGQDFKLDDGNWTAK